MKITINTKTTEGVESMFVIAGEEAMQTLSMTWDEGQKAKQ
jgi:hypothetical protein